MGWTYSLDELAKAIGAVAPDSEAVFSKVSTDTRTIEPGDVFFALKGETYDANQFLAQAFEKGAVAAVSTQDCAAGPCLVVPDPLKALQAFAAWHRRRFSIPVLGLTGSCGKTTTKDLIASVLSTRYNVIKTQGNLNNEIGCPLSLLQIDDRTEFAVIEMGANHMGEIASLCALAEPTEVAITMIAPAHLEGFGSIENVAKAKSEIVAGLRSDGTYYANADDAWCVKIAQGRKGKTIRFGSEGDVRLESYTRIDERSVELLVAPVGTLRLPLACRAHASNVLLAIAVGLEHGVTSFEAPLTRALQTTSRFKVMKIGPLTVVDDSYNANPASTAASLRAVAEWPGQGRRMAALGEMLELGEAATALHRDVGALAGTLGFSHVFAKGPHACDTINAALAAHVPLAEVFEQPLQVAERIHSIASVGDVLLIKGSRGMRMEHVVAALQERYR